MPYLKLRVKFLCSFFVTSEIVLSIVSSLELFNWPMVRDHITYFINFVLDLLLILKVYFLSYQLVCIHVDFYISHFFYGIFVFYVCVSVEMK